MNHGGLAGFAVGVLADEAEGLASIPFRITIDCGEAMARRDQW